jgi:hypothetical protein
METNMVSQNIPNHHTEADAAAPPTYALAYVSRLRSTWRPTDDKQLLSACMHTNPGLQVTGRLLFCKGLFFQLLEGPQASLHHLMQKIAQDSRHHRVVGVFLEKTQRRYTDFRMLVEDVHRTEFVSYITNCLTRIAGRPELQAAQIRHHALEYLAAPAGSTATYLRELQGVPGVWLYDAVIED